MRPLLALALGLLALGCETAPLGGRCESNLDCDRNTGAMQTAVCLSLANPGNACRGGECICCPVNESMRAMVSGCAVAPAQDTVPMDAADVLSPMDVVDVSQADVVDAPIDAPSEAGTCTPACGAGFFCSMGTCRPALSIGQACTDAEECGSGFCVSGVCCNSACTCAGCSCRLEPDFAGVCMRAPIDAGAAD